MRHSLASWGALWLSPLPLSLAHAGISAPFVIGFSHQDAITVNPSTLTITTTKECPATGMILVAESEVGSAFDNDSVTDDTNGGVGLGNVYKTAGSQFDNIPMGMTTGTIHGAMWTNNTNTYNGFDAPSGTTISVTYHPPSGTSINEAAIAVCVNGTREGPLWHNGPKTDPRYGKPLGPEGNGGGGNNDGLTTMDNNPRITPVTTLTNFGEIVFELTVIEGGAKDGWTESAAYTTLRSDTTIDATRLSYTIVNATTAPANVTIPTYSATNGAPRVWATNYIPYIPGTCGLTMGSGATC